MTKCVMTSADTLVAESASLNSALTEQIKTKGTCTIPYEIIIMCILYFCTLICYIDAAFTALMIENKQLRELSLGKSSRQ